MGCGSSRFLLDDATRPAFHVWNVDEHGHIIKPCHIQVTDTDIVLHQRGESPILWPLLSLRRYGFDEELFSFECGRHCTTGPGIYAFKCKEAASLFNILQECLQVFSESELGLSSLTGPEINGSSIIRNGSQETLEQDSQIGDTGQEALIDYGIDSQPSTSTGIKKIQSLLPERTKPTAPEESLSSESTPSLIPRGRLRQHSMVPKITPRPPLFYQKLSQYSSQKLPRCCVIGTCISASNQHYLTKQRMSNITCGSCRTCSLNMCVVRPSATYSGTADSEERARQADYGNALDIAGKPRQCVHCCCDFKPSKPMSMCSADDCPLHFNNCVDQVTNYAKLDEHMRHGHAAASKLRKKKLSMLQPVHFPSYAHLYTNIPTPTKKWPFSEQNKTSSWRSLPHFGQTTISLKGKLAPKRSISHFYADSENCTTVEDKKHSHKEQTVEKSHTQDKGEKLSMLKKPSAPVAGDALNESFLKTGTSTPVEDEKQTISSESIKCILIDSNED